MIVTHCRREFIGNKETGKLFVGFDLKDELFEVTREEVYQALCDMHKNRVNLTPLWADGMIIGIKNWEQPEMQIV